MSDFEDRGYDDSLGGGGHVFAIAPCLTCGRPFSFNPHKVPSHRGSSGRREPICRNCMTMINEKRQAMGLAPFAILPDAYDSLPEHEL